MVSDAPALTASATAWTRGSPVDRVAERVPYGASVDGDRVWTAAELEKMTPNERHRLFNERVVTDLSTLPPEVLVRIRAEGRALVTPRSPHEGHR
jgi:hypothetical protein